MEDTKTTTRSIVFAGPEGLAGLLAKFCYLVPSVCVIPTLFTSITTPAILSRDLAVDIASRVCLLNVREAHPKISRVYYPGLPSHPDHEVAKKQMKQFSGMVAFDIKDGMEAAKTFVQSFKIILLAVSLGSTESLVEHPATMTHGPYLMTKEERLAGGITDGLVRISVGIENIDDIIKDLEQALAKA
eukprot:XP_011668284.1 PREDICTED: cystathionine gamma-lyase [Strongylocentrotus purpuratus]